jgi:4-azaleucine resistance transporter AzlC
MSAKQKNDIRYAFRWAFPYTVPIFAGYWFIGLAYGIYMNVMGFGPLYPFFMALLVYGGSLEFIMVPMLLAPFAPVQMILVALLVQARHLFYGISMLDKYKGLGWKKPYLIFGLSDESFSVNYTAEIPPGVDRGWFYFFVTLLNHLYWVSGAAMGGIIGGHLPFDTTGLEFVMTAMFVAIFMEQWLKEKRHLSAWIGLGAAAVCLIVFGADRFMVPTMAAILLLLTLFRRRIGDPEDEEVAEA